MPIFLPQQSSKIISINLSYFPHLPGGRGTSACPLPEFRILSGVFSIAFTSPPPVARDLTRHSLANF